MENINNDNYEILIKFFISNGLINTITKNSIEFNVIDNYQVDDFCPNGFFHDNVCNGNWENDTFNIITDFADKSGIFLDIGSWIGPFTLYASKLYQHVYSFEPDKEAFTMLQQNVILNPNHNITLIPEALSDKTGKSLFGGNGKLGNSESTLLVRDINKTEDYFSQANKPGQRGNVEYRKQDIIEIDTLTIEDACKKYHINIFNIKLIKIDIEGGEYILIPKMIHFLTYSKPNLYISIHWCFLQETQIIFILDILFHIYNNKCYIYQNKQMKPISQLEIKQYKITDLLFLEN